MLSRVKFDLACQAFSHRRPQWAWEPGPYPGYGYLTRISTHFLKSSANLVPSPQSDGDEDDVATARPGRPALTVWEYIVFSASFGVPAFYFTMHDTGGAPLSLVEILDTSLFRFDLPSGSEATTFALTLPSMSFPLLSQGDHPTLGELCWYLHPCGMDNAVGEFLSEEEFCGWSEETRLSRWLELWIMIVGSVLNV